MDLQKILADHKLWLEDSAQGARANLYRANLRNADLRRADLCEADLRRADLCEADLSNANLCGANLCGANLSNANLCEANLCGANLRGVDLCGADLREADLCETYLCGADLREADLRKAILDFSSGIPMSCKGTNIIGGERLFMQLIYHLTRQNWQNLSDEQQEWLETIPYKNGFCKFRNDVKEI